ncbi:MAG: hypothetical protein HYY22_01405 [Thaumarchaeota archaeon]|nr:hypothetical protein [Nitrososphaerota archaeon]
MVKISYRPWEQIIIHEIIEETPQALYSMLVQQMLASGAAGMTPTINWVDGVVLIISALPDTPEVIKDKLNGILHYSAVTFARVPSYQHVTPVTVNNNTYQIRLHKIENNDNFIELAKLLKGRKKEA